MELRELKKEIGRLTSMGKTLTQFQNSWLKPLRSNTNSKFPFLQDLNPATKKELNSFLASYQQLLPHLKYFQFTNEKLSSLAHYLIELKLASLNGDNLKPRLLVDKFLEDDFLNLKLLIDEANQLEFDLDQLKQIYSQANALLLPTLPLEHSLTFLDAPHKNYLNALLLTAQKQKKLLKLIGQEFVSLTKEMKKNKKL